MQSQSTTARQLRASIVSAVCLTVAGQTPQNIANSVAKHRTEETEKLRQVIAGDHEAAPDAKVWRDSFCADCESNETQLADAQTFAQFLFDRGWRGQPKRHNLFCPKCEVFS